MKQILLVLKIKFLSNFGIKILSLIVAIVIWISLASQGWADKTFIDIPYEIRNLPINLDVVDRGAGSIKVTARGPQNLISAMKPDSFSVPVILPDDVGSGVIAVDINTETIKTAYSNQITIMQVSPPSVTIKLEEVVTKTVRIIPYLKGTLASGFELGTIETQPQMAEIKGPNSLIEVTDRILTEPIDVTGVNITFNERVDLKSSDKLMRIVDPLRTTVTVEVKEKIIERTFPEFEINVLKSDPDPGISVDPSVATLTLKGPQRIITSLQTSDLDLVADCRELQAGNFEIPLVMNNQPSGIISYITDPPGVIAVVPTFQPTPIATLTPGSGTENLPQRENGNE